MSARPGPRIALVAGGTVPPTAIGIRADDPETAGRLRHALDDIPAIADGSIMIIRSAAGVSLVHQGRITAGRAVETAVAALAAAERVAPVERPLLLADWGTAGYRWRHPRDLRSEHRTGADPARHGALRALRATALAPWLDGRRPVRDLAAFREFHALDAPAESLLRRMLADAPTPVVLAVPCLDGCHPGDDPVAVDHLVGAGWAVRSGLTGRLSPGPRIGRLNRAAGELGAP